MQQVGPVGGQEQLTVSSEWWARRRTPTFCFWPQSSYQFQFRFVFFFLLCKQRRLAAVLLYVTASMLAMLSGVLAKLMCVYVGQPG